MKRIMGTLLIALLIAGGVYIGTHLSFEDPYKMSPIFYGATMSEQERSADRLKAHAMKPEATQELYKLMQDVATLLQKNHIDYWATCGTLLGAVRHEGVIPYDDDLDVCIWQKDLEKLKSLTADLREMGYEIYQDRTSLKIYKKNGLPVRPKRKSFQLFKGVWLVRHKKEKFPFMDIYTMEEKGNKIHYHLAKAREVFPQEFYLEGEVYPLKQYTFGPLTVWGPHNAINFFQRNYGSNWNSALVFTGNHAASSDKGFSMPLTPELRHKLMRYQGF